MRTIDVFETALLLLVWAAGIADMCIFLSLTPLGGYLSMVNPAALIPLPALVALIWMAAHNAGIPGEAPIDIAELSC